MRKKSFFSWNLKQFIHEDYISIRFCSNSSKKKKEKQFTNQRWMRDHGLLWWLWWPEGGAASWRDSGEAGINAGWWRRAEVAPGGGCWALSFTTCWLPSSIQLPIFFFWNVQYVHITFTWVLLYLYSFFSFLLKIVLLKLVKFDST